MMRGDQEQGVRALVALITLLAAVSLSAVMVQAEMTRAATPTQSQPLPKPPRYERPKLPDPPSHSGYGRRIVFDQSEQRVWLVRGDGSVARSYLVTGSRRDNVRPGSYVVQSRIRHARTYKGNGTFEYFVRFTEGRTAPIGFHSVTVNRQGRTVYARADLGTANTPGCVEQWLGDAKALWAFAPTGTLVEVVR